MFDFEQLSDCCHILDVFKVFGKQITRIKISEKDVQYKEQNISKLDKILQLISTYCTIDALKHLDLQYFYGTSIEKRYMHAALPFFRAIEYFSLNEVDKSGLYKCSDYFINNRGYNPAVNELVERIIGKATNLTSIQLTRLKVTGRFFFADHVRNLNNLSIVESNIRAPNGFIAFLESAPKLVSFRWDSSSLFGRDTDTSHSSNIVYELVAKNVPDLESFHYDQNEFFMTERNRCSYVRNFSFPNHELIRNFGKLKVLGLKTMETECLQLLAEMNTVEKLEANLPLQPEINFDFMRTFTNLKSVKFHTHDFGKQNHMNYLAKLPQLIECHVSVTELFSDFDDVLVKLVESANNLSTLRLTLLVGKLKVGLYPKLLDARLAHAADSVNPLTICLEKQELKRFMGRLRQAYRPDVIQIQ